MYAFSWYLTGVKWPEGQHWTPSASTPTAPQETHTHTHTQRLVTLRSMVQQQLTCHPTFQKNPKSKDPIKLGQSNGTLVDVLPPSQRYGAFKSLDRNLLRKTMYLQVLTAFGCRQQRISAGRAMRSDSPLDIGCFLLTLWSLTKPIAPWPAPPLSVLHQPAKV